MSSKFDSFSESEDQLYITSLLFFTSNLRQIHINPFKFSTIHQFDAFTHPSNTEQNWTLDHIQFDEKKCVHLIALFAIQSGSRSEPKEQKN